MRSLNLSSAISLERSAQGLQKHWALLTVPCLSPPFPAFPLGMFHCSLAAKVSAALPVPEAIATPGCPGRSSGCHCRMQALLELLEPRCCLPHPWSSLQGWRPRCLLQAMGSLCQRRRGSQGGSIGWSPCLVLPRVWRASGSAGGQRRWAPALADPGHRWAAGGIPAVPKRPPTQARSSSPRLADSSQEESAACPLLSRALPSAASLLLKLVAVSCGSAKTMPRCCPAPRIPSPCSFLCRHVSGAPCSAT